MPWLAVHFTTLGVLLNSVGPQGCLHGHTPSTPNACACAHNGGNRYVLQTLPTEAFCQLARHAAACPCPHKRVQPQQRAQATKGACLAAALRSPGFWGEFHCTCVSAVGLRAMTLCCAGRRRRIVRREGDTRHTYTVARWGWGWGWGNSLFRAAEDDPRLRLGPPSSQSKQYWPAWSPRSYCPVAFVLVAIAYANGSASSPHANPCCFCLGA